MIGTQQNVIGCIKDILRWLYVQQNMQFAALTKKVDHITKSMRNVYWLAKEKMALSKFSSLQNLMKIQGVDLNALNTHGDTYCSRTTGEEFLDSIVSVIEKSMDNDIKEQARFSVMIDESTDISVTKKLVIYIRYVNKDMKVETRFLGNLGIADAHVNADKVFSMVKEFLLKRGIDVSQVIGFGSDGAGIMTGCKTGVATRMKAESPHCIAIHCMAHRLNLASSQAAESVPYLKEYQQTLTDLFRYFHQSTARSASLQAMQKVLELPR